MSKTTKKVENKELKKEMVTTPQAFAVMKRCEDCETPQDRVKPYDAMMGIGSISMSPDQVQGVYFEEKAALAEASKLHKLHEEDMKMLEEKKGMVLSKLFEKIDALEAERTKHFKAKNYDQEAEVASKIQELKDKLKKIEKATKLKKKSEDSDSKKKLSEEEGVSDGSLLNSVKKFIGSDPVFSDIKDGIRVTDKGKSGVELKYGSWLMLPLAYQKHLFSKFEGDVKEDDRNEFHYQITGIKK